MIHEWPADLAWMVNSKKMVISYKAGPKIFQIFLRGKNHPESVQMTKTERIFCFKPYVYLPYLRNYGHFKIVNCMCLKSLYDLQN